MRIRSWQLDDWYVDSVLRHVRFTLNFHFNSFSSALLSCDPQSCDSSHDPFHSFTYHMITPHSFSHMTHCLPHESYLYLMRSHMSPLDSGDCMFHLLSLTHSDSLWITPLFTYDSAGNTCLYDSLLLYCALILRRSSVVLKSSSLGTL